MRSVFLVGFMGSGKSTVGRRLAQRIDLPFVDLDEEIERAQEETIPEIFERSGEHGFRDAETRALAAQINGPPAVVATGGGLFAAEIHRISIARSGGCAVFLDVPWEVIERRIGSDDGCRPLWRNGAANRRLFDERLPAYQQADVVIRLEGQETPEEVAETVRRMMTEVACGT